MNTVAAANALDAWMQALDTVPSEGECYTDQDGRACKEFRHVLLSIQVTTDATALIQAVRRTLPALYPSVDEFKAHLFGTDRAAFEWNIGNRLFGGSSQIDAFLLPLLSTHPTSRRGIVLCYDPSVDSHAGAANVPSLVSVQFRIIDGSLEVTTVLRSCDAFLGLPANIWQTHALQEYVAHKLAVPCGQVTLMIESLHWFESYAEEAATVVPTVRRLLAANGQRVSGALTGSTKKAL